MEIPRKLGIPVPMLGIADPYLQRGADIVVGASSTATTD